ncbi:MAG: hypothetical protein ACRYGA_02415 [Janthinobacterium lividum]
MSEQQLGATASQAVADLRNARNALATKSVVVVDAVAASDGQVTTVGSFTARLEAVLARLQAKQSAGTDDIGVFHMSAIAEGVRPATFANSISGGPVAANWGDARGLGAAGSPNAAFGSGVYSVSSSDGNCAVTIDQLLTFDGDFMGEYFTDDFDADNLAMQLSTNGTDAGALRLQLVARKDNGRLYFHSYAQKSGTPAFLAFETDRIDPMAVAGMASGYHLAFGRVNGYPAAFCNQKRIGLATQPFAGSLTGNFDLIGAYDRVSEQAQGSRGKQWGEARLSKLARYKDLTYVVPNSRFA